MEDFEVQKERGEIISDAEIESFRQELEGIKKEAIEKSAKEEEINPNTGLINLDFDKLVKTDWFLYKLYKQGNLTLKILSHHRAKDLGVQTMDILEAAAKKNQRTDLETLPRETFLAWLGNRFVVEEAKKILEKKRRGKAA